MRYMGSKRLHSKELIKTIETSIGTPFIGSSYSFMNYIEPFVGGCNMIDKIPDVFNKKIGNDINFHVIEMFKSLQNGWTPPDSITEEQYKQLKELSKTHSYEVDNALIGFVGCACSYGGKWFGGFARGKNNKGTDRNYCFENKKSVLGQNIQNVVFTSAMVIEGRCNLIYCDPPYANSTNYKDKFDHNKFWKWCDRQVFNGNKVFVSEYNAPEGWRCIWQKEVNNILTKETGSKQGIEKLFTK